MNARKQFFRRLIVSLALAVLLAGCRVVTNGNYFLGPGERVNGTLLVTAGNVELGEGSQVTGSVIVTSGNLTANGQIDGDVLLTAGNAIFGPQAVVEGGVTTLGGNIQRAPGAEIRGGEGPGLRRLLLVGAAAAVVCLLPLIVLGLLVWLVVGRGRPRPAQQASLRKAPAVDVEQGPVTVASNVPAVPPPAPPAPPPGETVSHSLDADSVRVEPGAAAFEARTGAVPPALPLPTTEVVKAPPLPPPPPAPRGRSSPGGLVAGLILIALGVLFLLDQWIGLGGFTWPLILLGGGVLFLLGMVLGGRGASGLAVPGTVLTALGLIFLYQETFNHYESWAYAWALVLAAVGLGIALQGAYSGNPARRREGLGLARVGLILFIVFGAFFELVINLSGFGRGAIGALVWPALLIAVGLYMLLFRVILRR